MAEAVGLLWVGADAGGVLWFMICLVDELEEVSLVHGGCVAIKLISMCGCVIYGSG